MTFSIYNFSDFLNGVKNSPCKLVASNVFLQKLANKCEPQSIPPPTYRQTAKRNSPTKKQSPEKPMSKAQATCTALHLRRHCMLKSKIETPAVGFGFEFGWFFMLTRKIMIILLRILSLFSGSCVLFGFLSKLADFHVRQWNKYMEIYV